MDISEYIEVVSPEEIKIRGHRVWMEHILSNYIGQKMNVEELERQFPTLSRTKILAALLYYHAHEADMTQYMAEHRRSMAEARRVAAADPEVQRFRAKIERLAAERRAAAGTE